MRISDWSSDVCSSDLSGLPRGRSDGRVSDMERESGERVWRSRSSMVQVPAPVRSSPALIDPAYERRFDFVQCHSKRSEEHTSELQSLMRISYAVFCLKKNKNPQQISTNYKSPSRRQ